MRVFMRVLVRDSGLGCGTLWYEGVQGFRFQLMSCILRAQDLGRWM